MQCNEALTALVTGGASGLGAGTVAHLRSLGCHVVSTDLPESDGLNVAESVGAHFIPCDVSDPGNIKSMVEQAQAKAGSIRLLVNCAGIAPAARTVSRDGPHSPELFAKVININLIGSFVVSSEVASHMASNEPLSDSDNERGVIINTASVAAFDGQIGQAAYAASKAAVAGMSLPMARDLSSLGIRVLAIAPGIFATPMVTGMPEEVQESLAAQVPFPKRLGLAKDYAALVQHITENTMLNAEVIRLDGAIRMGMR